LPTDSGQTYTISVSGTGTGTFTITDATISNSSITQTQVFSNISVTPSLVGRISLSNNTNTTLSLDTDGNGITDSTLQPSSVLNATQSQNFVPIQPVINTTHIPSGSGGLVSAPIVAESKVTVAKVDDTPVLQSVITPEIKKETLVNFPEIPKQIAVEVSTKSPVVKSQNISVAIAPKRNKEKENPVSEPTLVAKQTENLPAKIPLAANVADTKIPISSKVILGGLLGLLLILLF